MSNWVNSIIENCKNWIGNITNEAISSGLIAIGTYIEEVAMIVIAIGALLWICKNTKLFRWGCISYAIGLLIELIGSVMIK